VREPKADATNGAAQQDSNAAARSVNVVEIQFGTIGIHI